MRRQRDDNRKMLFVSISAIFVCADAYVDFTYRDVDHWATDYPGQCDGQSQSPIDLVYALVNYDVNLQNDPFVFTGYDTTNGVTWSIGNNGHTVGVTYTAGNLQMTGGGLQGTFKVAQFHFHWGSNSSVGSEHVVNGLSYPMELHIVHYNMKYPNISTAISNSDGLAVLGFFFEIQAANNPQMQKIVDEIPNVVNPSSRTSMTPFALDNLIAGTQDFFRYSGSLTTPTCNEVVTWTVFKHTIKISETQMAAFRTLIGIDYLAMVNIFRPPQTLYGRSITASFVDTGFYNSASSAASSILVLAASLLLSIGLRF